MLVALDLSNLCKKATSNPGRKIEVVEIHVQLIPYVGVMTGIWNWKGLLSV